MVEAAVSRLRWISLICAGLTGLAVYLEGQLQPEVSRLLKDPILALVLLSVVLSALGINAIQRYRLVSPVGILNLGLAFEVVVAAAISFSETALPRLPDGPVLGASKVALWIGLVGLLIPNKPWIKFVTALACATTWPCAYVLNLHLYAYEPLRWNRLLIWIHLPYVMAFVNFGLSRRMWVMEQAFQKARELGSYHLVSLIGKGGMGEVWRARHGMLARDAAIKVIRADLMMMRRGYDSVIVRKRFEQEAQAIASLRSPHTVHLYDFGVSEDGSPYYVMELLDGVSLQVLVNKFGPQPLSRVVHILRQVCGSLEEAHRQGLIHRDIKPNNIFSCAVGVECDFVKVLDFGLVKNVSQEKAMHLTAPGGLAGTPAYIAPEVALGARSIDARLDIYALGCVAYFLLTGSPVFDEKTASAMVMAHVHKTPVPPSQRSGMPVPSEFESVILRCLAKRPEERPQSALELSRLIAAIAGVPEWTPEDAETWWQTHLPVSSSYRNALQPRSAGRQREIAHAEAGITV
jgi:serine/threonine-protein kinase